MPNGELRTYDFCHEPLGTLEDLKRTRDNLISEITQGQEVGAEDRRRMSEAIEELEKRIEELEK